MNPQDNDTAAGDVRQELPSVSVMLEHPKISALRAAHPRALVVEAIRQALIEMRNALRTDATPPDADAVAARTANFLQEAERDRIRPVVNATGILLHTGLGRAVLPTAAATALGQMDRCCNLQVDLETGLRGKRNHTCEQLLCRLTGAEAALIVNNNAAATLLILSALCAEGDVVVSRGQLIEIGGSYRLPDCIHQSGARLVEVGTTNKTHLRDYAAVLNENTRAVMRVNPSNYRIVGFEKSVSVAELVTLKKDRDLIVIDDLGCGALLDLETYGLPHEPTVQDSTRAGADIVCFSGDKLIGGPQAGIIVGRSALVQRIRKHPLTRMLRVGKLTDAALEATLRLFLEPERLPEVHPTLRMLGVKPETLRRRARRLCRRINESAPGLRVRVLDGESAVGGGSLPHVGLPTSLVGLRAPGFSAEALNATLRRHDPPIIARIQRDEVVLDMRTLLDGDDRTLVEAAEALAANQSKEDTP